MFMFKSAPAVVQSRHQVRRRCVPV